MTTNARTMTVTEMMTFRESSFAKNVHSVLDSAITQTKKPFKKLRPVFNFDPRGEL
jgi:hypothetical protein